MSKVVEITIDLTNPNCKPRIETFEITKVGEMNIYCKGNGVWEHGRRFYIPNMNAVYYRGFLKYTYRYQTEETDYVQIVESPKTADAIKLITGYLTSDLACYQSRLDGNLKYYQQAGRSVKTIE